MSSFIRQQAVVIGAGIGGLTAARALAEHCLSFGERSCCPAAGHGRAGKDQRRRCLAPKSHFAARLSMLRIRHDGDGCAVVNMKIICAWCSRDGQPCDLGEREPLENPEPTHGVCARHKAELLESLPSQSFPDAELLIVVRRDETALYENLERSFAAMSRVKVIVDRRVSDRRAAPRQKLSERRYVRTRRVREGIPLGNVTILRFTPKKPLTPALLALNVQ